MTDENKIVSLFFTEIKDDIREIKTDVKEIFQSMRNQPCATNTEKILRMEKEIESIKNNYSNRPMKALAIIVSIASVGQVVLTFIR